MRLDRSAFAAFALLAVALLAPLPNGAANAATGANQTRSTHVISVGGVERTWLDIAPSGPAARSVPIIVILSGSSATLAQEIARDGLVPLVNAGRADLLYPLGVGESWNAGVCCGEASSENIDDVGFLQALVSQVDPRKARPIYLVGYSDGGRLAYRIACNDPTLFDAMAVMKAMPEPGCVVSRPQSILQVDSTNDNYVPYRPGEPGKEQPAALTEVALLRKVFACAPKAVVSRHGLLLFETWSPCAGHTRFAFASYTGGLHTWPEGNATTPSGASVVWSFFSNSPLVRPFFPSATPCSAYWC